MNVQSKKFFSGNSVEQAVLQAARHFGLDPGEVSYRTLDKRHGFLKVRRRVVIEVDPEAPGGAGARSPEPSGREVGSPERRSPDREPKPQPPSGPRSGELQPPQPKDRQPKDPRPRDREPGGAPAPAWHSAPSAPRPEAAAGRGSNGATAEASPLVSLPEGPRRAIERFPRAEGPVASGAGEALARIFRLASLRLEAEVLQGEERLEIELWGPDQELLLADRGRLLLAIEHLLPRLIRGLTGEGVHCRVDCDNFHEIRAEQLRDLAQRVASEVRQKGRPQQLEPMSPDERRIVHLILSDDPAVETQSQGDGLFKRITVKPIRRRRG